MRLKDFSLETGIFFASSPKISDFPLQYFGTGIGIEKIGDSLGTGTAKTLGYLGFIPKFPRFSGLETGTKPLNTGKNQY